MLVVGVGGTTIGAAGGAAQTGAGRETTAGVVAVSGCGLMEIEGSALGAKTGWVGVVEVGQEAGVGAAAIEATGLWIVSGSESVIISSSLGWGDGVLRSRIPVLRGAFFLYFFGQDWRGEGLSALAVRVTEAMV
jgi:hypothetical protein